MRYIHALEEKKFKEEKEKENKLLRLFGASEELIKELYEYDRDMFLKNRRYSENECLLEEEKYKNIEHTNIPYVSLKFYDNKPLEAIDDLIYALNYIFSFSKITVFDTMTLEIILLKIQGYKYKEISMIMGISIHQVKYIIKKFKEKLK